MKRKRKRFQKMTNLFLFIFCWLFIALVSSIDVTLTIHTKEVLIQTEQNPLAIMILEASNWHIGNFIGLKMFGTLVSLGMLVLIYQFSNRHGLTVAIALAILELVLLYYLVVF